MDVPNALQRGQYARSLLNAPTYILLTQLTYSPFLRLGPPLGHQVRRRWRQHYHFLFTSFSRPNRHSATKSAASACSTQAMQLLQPL